VASTTGLLDQLDRETLVFNGCASFDLTSMIQHELAQSIVRSMPAESTLEGHHGEESSGCWGEDTGMPLERRDFTIL
jgi:hypothetical protein